MPTKKVKTSDVSLEAHATSEVKKPAARKATADAPKRTTPVHRTTRAKKAAEADAAAVEPSPAVDAPVIAPVAQEDLQTQISRLAYQLWLEGGCRDGYAHEDWARAEQIVLSRR
jgi:hypothetical protein